MNEFQVMVVGSAVTAGQASDAQPGISARSASGDRVVAGIDQLGDVWDTVIGKLTGLAAQSRAAAEGSDFELSTIEFNLGIEAGLNIGFVTRGEASVSVTFARKPEPPGA
ncbi:hypothetical protein [uncultured Cellulomonas sp.]|uniref:hypothetical protein n=1 Tax=uncultured Cellulomonas sp. TaxID=189682 RepID=UPI00262BC7CB|nr:hypothetical protein [uncultured Cellulomonas sp.]